MKKQPGISMTEGTPWRHTVRFAIPVLAGALLQQLYSTVDMMIVGRFTGENALSAVGTTGSFVFLLLTVALGISAGNGVIVSQRYGAEDELGLRENAASGIVLLTILGIGATVFGIAVSRPACVHLIAVPEEILNDTLLYFRIYSLGLVFQYGYNAVSSILRAVGDSLSTLYFLVISSVLNILLDLLFVAVFRWGVAGAAIATGIAQAASLTAAGVYMHRKYPVFRFHLRDFRWQSDRISETIRMGLPISLHLMVVSVGLTFIQRAVNGFGPAMIASFTVGHRIELYLNLPCHAFQTTLATYTGQNYGAGKLDRVKSGTSQTLLISVGMTLIISALVWTSASWLVELFALGDEAASYCLRHLRAVAFINIVLSLYLPLFGVFQGTGHTIVPMVVVIGALGVRVFVTYLFRYSPFLGAGIIWWNGIFGFGTGCLIAWAYYLSGRWMTGQGGHGGRIPSRSA